MDLQVIQNRIYPEDFMFEMNIEEWEILRIVILLIKK